jgi:hypothetical protein
MNLNHSLNGTLEKQLSSGAHSSHSAYFFSFHHKQIQVKTIKHGLDFGVLEANK